MKLRAMLLWSFMSETYFRIFRSDEMLYLARKHPNAFILLTFIAARARRENGHPDGLVIGECHIGDHKEYGLTEKEYRTAKKILVDRNHIKIIETCRTRKSDKKTERAGKKIEIIENVKKTTTERATKVTTIGTLVQLCSLTIYDINPEDPNQRKGDRNGDRGATEGRPKGDEQEGIRKDISNDISKEEEAQTAKRLRSKDDLTFDFEKWEFNGITEKDLADWKLMYPHIDLTVETLKAAQWLKNNQSKSNKKSFRKYLTGWYGRANDSIENKKAYRAASGSTSQDRRTKDIHGNPVSSPHDGRF